MGQVPEPQQVTPRFRCGDRVTLPLRDTQGYGRAPFYLQGHSGEVVRVHGAFLDAERRAHGHSGLPAVVVVQVAFAYGDLWPHQPAPTGVIRILADLQENWLVPALDPVAGSEAHSDG
jgi:hypothetical protein